MSTQQTASPTMTGPSIPWGPDLYGPGPARQGEPDQPVHRRRGWVRLGADTLYLMTSFPIALAAFVTAVTLGSVGFGLAIVWAGLPILVLAMLLTRAFARLERTRLTVLLGEDIHPHRYRLAGADSGVVRRLLTVLVDPQSWRDLVWTAVSFASSTAVWSIGLAWWAGALGGLTFGLWNNPTAENLQLGEWIAGELGLGWVGAVAANVTIGALFALTLPIAMRVLATLNAAVSSLLLNAGEGGER